MLTVICQYLKNWFSDDQPKKLGDFQIESGVISTDTGEDIGLQSGQYFRVIGSVFNDGVWKEGSTSGMVDESFSGAVWLMALPKEIEALDAEMEEWMTKYGGVDSPNLSPYDSESFAGYSYKKATGSSSSGNNVLNDCFSAFSTRLRLYKRI